jgi:hypothetical protein
MRATPQPKVGSLFSLARNEYIEEEKPIYEKFQTTK